MNRQNPNRLARLMAAALKVEGATTEDETAAVLVPMLNDALHLERGRRRPDRRWARRSEPWRGSGRVR